MYQHKLLLQELRPLVGFTDSPAGAGIDADLKGSLSGLRISEGTHPLLSHDNILSVVEQFGTTAVKTYASGTYAEGDIVKQGTDIFQSLADGNSAATSDAAGWRKTTLYSAYLRRLRDASIANMLSRLFMDKKLQGVAKTLHGSLYLYDGVGNLSDRIQKQGRMVGFKIRVKSPDVSAIIRQIGLQVDTAQNGVKLYLYHSSNNQPLKVWELNHTASIRPQWHQIEGEVLSDISAGTFPGGCYYLCYRQSELTGLAVKKQNNFITTADCTSCGGITKSMFLAWSPHLSIQPFMVDEADLPAGGAIWDEGREMYVDDNSFGLNLQVSIQCDVSRVLVENKALFAEALVQQMKFDMLTAMAYSVRDNQRRDRLASMAAVALDNKEYGEAGEAKKLEKAISALSFDFSGISSVCLPCNDRNQQVRKSSIWR